MISEHSDDEEVLINCPMCNKPICPDDVNQAENAAQRQIAIELAEI